MKKLVLSSIIIIGLGLVLTAIGFALTGGKIMFANVREKDYSKQAVSGNELFEKLEVSFNVRDIILELSEDESYKIEYYEADYDKVNVNIVNNTLKISGERERYRFFNWPITSSDIFKVKIYIPLSFNGSVSIVGSTGKVEIKPIPELDDLYIKLSTGKVIITNLKANDIVLKTSTGSVDVNYLEAVTLNITVSTGSIILNNSKITNITYLYSSTGTIKVNNLETLQINSNSSTGRTTMEDIIVDDLDVTTSTGTITIKIIGKHEDYKIDCRVSTGSIRFQGEKYGTTLISLLGSKSVKARSSTGSVNLDIDE